MHIFQNSFLRWRRESKPVDLNTMNPIIWAIFFSPLKGSEPNFGGNSGGLRKLRFGWKYFCELIILFLMGKWFVFICFWHFNFFGQPYPLRDQDGGSHVFRDNKHTVTVPGFAIFKAYSSVNKQNITENFGYNVIPLVSVWISLAGNILSLRF